MKLLIVYNTAEIRGIGNIPFYVNAIQSLLMQRLNPEHSIKIVVSACAPSDMWIIQSQNTFKNAISYNFVRDKVPVSVTFNDSVEKMHQHFGDFDATLYLDSGITFWDPTHHYDALQTMLYVHQSGPYAMTAAMPSNDSGFEWWNIPYSDEDYVFPLGKTTNLHCQLFDKSWRTAYGKILPDIFASHCMESVFTGMAAAIEKKFIITKKVHVLHIHSMDGASSATMLDKTDRYPMSSTFEVGGLWFRHKKTVDEKYREGYALGFGIEECKPYWPHNPECFDANGYAKNKELAAFLKREMYLNAEEFNYRSLTEHFIAGL